MINLICLHLGLIEPPDHIVLHLALMPDFINPLFHGGGNLKKKSFFFFLFFQGNATSSRPARVGYGLERAVIKCQA